MSHPDLATCELEDHWMLAEGLLDENPVIVRVREGLRPLVGHPQLGQRLRIVWEYRSDEDSGLPLAAELPMLERFEDTLVAAYESDRLALLAHVLTCDGLRQWVFYTSDPEQCVERLNDAFADEPEFPIELSADADPDWSEFLETLDSQQG